MTERRPQGSALGAWIAIGIGIGVAMSRMRSGA
jgi:hypothetical protein